MLDAEVFPGQMTVPMAVIDAVAGFMSHVLLSMLAVLLSSDHECQVPVAEKRDHALRTSDDFSLPADHS